MEKVAARGFSPPSDINRPRIATFQPRFRPRVQHRRFPVKARRAGECDRNAKRLGQRERAIGAMPRVKGREH
jgi:hypothetical protein